MASFKFEFLVFKLTNQRQKYNFFFINRDTKEIKVLLAEYTFLLQALIGERECFLKLQVESLTDPLNY